MSGHEMATAKLLWLLYAHDARGLDGLLTGPAGSLMIQHYEGWGRGGQVTSIYAEDLGLALQCLRDAQDAWTDLYCARRGRLKIPEAWLEREYGGELLAPEAQLLREAAQWPTERWSLDALNERLQPQAEALGWEQWRYWRSEDTGQVWMGARMGDGDPLELSVGLDRQGQLAGLVICEDCGVGDHPSIVAELVLTDDHLLVTPGNLDAALEWATGAATELALAHLASDRHLNPEPPFPRWSPEGADPA